jgi:MoxR-like ATPase
VRAQRFKLLRALAEVFAALFVAGDDLHTVSAQKLDERRVAHADAEHCRCFSPQGG